MSVDEALNILLSSRANELDFEYDKNKRCLKKVYKNLDFVLDFYSNKWDKAGKSIDVNVGFHIYNRDYGKLPTDSVVAYKMYKPDNKEWYDITTKEKLEGVIKELNIILKDEVLSLYKRFENNYIGAVEYLFGEKFDEFNVYLDFVQDNLGKDKIINKAHEIYSSLSDIMIVQIAEYKKGVRNKIWMLNRNNIKYIVDNGIIEK